jgi:hypothetical protein
MYVFYREGEITPLIIETVNAHKYAFQLYMLACGLSLFEVACEVSRAGRVGAHTPARLASG